MERTSSRARWVCVAAVVGTVVLLAARGELRSQDRQPEGREDGSALMKKKLDRSQQVLSGLLRGDMKEVQRGAAGLHAIARVPAVGHEDDAVYNHFNVEFQRLTEKLQRVAGNGNDDAAAYVHGQITSTCISCHQHVRDVKPLGGTDE